MAAGRRSKRTTKRRPAREKPLPIVNIAADDGALYALTEDGTVFEYELVEEDNMEVGKWRQLSLIVPSNIISDDDDSSDDDDDEDDED